MHLGVFALQPRTVDSRYPLLKKYPQSQPLTLQFCRPSALSSLCGPSSISAGKHGTSYCDRRSKCRCAAWLCSWKDRTSLIQDSSAPNGFSTRTIDEEKRQTRITTENPYAVAVARPGTSHPVERRAPMLYFFQLTSV